MDEEQKDNKAETKAKPEPKPDPRLPVRVVSIKAGSALVEWRDEGGFLRRAYLPASKVKEGSAATRDLEKAAPYGLPWEKWIRIPTAEEIANELRRAGVWGRDDLGMPAIQKAILMAFGITEFLRRIVREVDK